MPIICYLPRVWGLSGLITATTDNGVGYGGILRYGDWHVGAAYHEKDSDALVYISIDLYDILISKEKRDSISNKYLKKLANKVAENMK